MGGDTVERCNEPHWVRATCGGLASMTAEIATLPIDTIKVRLQLEKGTKRIGAVSCLRSIIRQEGATALWKGLSAALTRQAVYSTARMGAYEPVRNILGDSSSSVWNKILAGGIGGMFGALIANPTDLVKVRLQADVAGTRYSGMIDALGAIVRAEGVNGLWKGVGPNLQRAFIVNAAELATYDHVKHMMKNNDLMQEGVALHGIASFCAGLAAAATSTPVDTMKTRLMQQPVGADGKGLHYSGMIDCLRQTVSKEGPMGLYRGFLPTWFRIGPWAMIMFMSFEKYRDVANATMY